MPIDNCVINMEGYVKNGGFSYDDLNYFLQITVFSY